LEGRVALVTGGARGIGRAVVHRYLAEGAAVGVLDRDVAALAELADLGVATTVGDVRDPAAHAAATERVLARFGALDTYVGNAGIYDYGAGIDDIEPGALPAAFTEVFETNVLGLLLGVRAALDALRAARGSVVLTASSSSSYAGGGGVLYVAAKHAVTGLVRQLAFELAPDVRVNAVAPGATNTDLSGVGALGSADRVLRAELDRSRTARGIPLGFVSEPEHHTGLFVALADPTDTGFTTGAVLPSDGGLEVRGGGRRRT
jgi:NAD(P)-dependent dehydrogenase (short-subunit alcohol dehydrogenase family)